MQIPAEPIFQISILLLSFLLVADQLPRVEFQDESDDLYVSGTIIAGILEV